MFFTTKEFKDTKSSTDDQPKSTKSSSTCTEETPSLLIILDDKNKTISLLQEQLSNQKKQLSFYLNQAFDRKKLQEFSLKCLPQAVDENIAVDLAHNKFCRQSGLKSRLVKVHERMCDIDIEIRRAVRQQQCVLRDILNNMYELAQSDDETLALRRCIPKVYDSIHPDLFGDILNATLRLVQTLDMFRICADRLILIEDERNEIVEQVCTLSAEQRLNCNYIIGIQMDKMKMEDQVKTILEDQEELKKRLREYSHIEENLQKLQSTCDLNGRINSDEKINSMLDEINTEAVEVLRSTEYNKSRHADKIMKLKSENDSLKKMLKDNMVSVEVSNSCQIENEYFIQLKKMYELLKKNFDYEKMTILQQQVNDSQSLQMENDILKNQLNTLVTEKDDLKKEVEKISENLDEIKSEYKFEVDLVKSERDSFKNQVEDLLAIRSAYSQLIEKQTEKCVVEKEFYQKLKKLEKIIYDLKHENELLRKKSSSYEEICTMQKSQIKYLFKMVQKLTGMYEDHDEIRNNRYTERLIDHTFIEKDNFGVEFNSTHVEDFDIYSKNLHTKDILLQKMETQPTSITSSLIGNVSHKNSSISSTNILLPTNNIIKNMESIEMKENISELKQDDSTEKISNDSKTYLRLQSTHRTGKKSTFKAVINSTDDLEGSFTIGETCVILKLGGSNVIKNADNVNPVNSNDEFELLRDASNETLPQICPSTNASDNIFENDSSRFFSANNINSETLKDYAEKDDQVVKNIIDTNSVVDDDFKIKSLDVSDIRVSLKNISPELEEFPTQLSKSTVSSRLKKIHGKIYS